jgi:hypothetical protein
MYKESRIVCQRQCEHDKHYEQDPSIPLLILRTLEAASATKAPRMAETIEFLEMVMAASFIFNFMRGMKNESQIF